MPTNASDRLKSVRDRLALSCQRASRPIESVNLLAVTKTRSETEIMELYSLGLRNFGENRVAEAVKKQNSLPGDIEWHMIGHLQSNKAKECLGFSLLHSLDKIETARSIEKAFSQAGQTLRVLLEANTGGEDAKDGVTDIDGLLRLAESIAGLPHLKIQGLMTMAPFSQDENLVRPCFSRLREWRDVLASSFPGEQWATLSMGMTNDFEWAVAEGSTLVRIGTALFEGFR